MEAPGAQSPIIALVDHTPDSEEALAIACEIARKEGALTEVHVVRALLGASNCLDMESERRLLGHVCATYAARFGVVVKPHLSLESPEAAIAEVARANRATLVVVGDRRRRWFERLVTGSLAERLTRDAPCPVLVTHSRAGRPAERSASPPSA
jgi:nucleotide-binding universal stress UspA family protein